MIVGNTAWDTARLFRHFFAAYPARSSLMLLAITAAALAEGVGIAALLPMIGLVIEAEGSGGMLTRYVEQVFAFAGEDVSLGRAVGPDRRRHGAQGAADAARHDAGRILRGPRRDEPAARVHPRDSAGTVVALHRPADRRSGKRGQHRADAHGRGLRRRLSRCVGRDSSRDLPGSLHGDILGDIAARARRRRLRHDRLEPGWSS